MKVDHHANGRADSARFIPYDENFFRLRWNVAAITGRRELIQSQRNLVYQWIVLVIRPAQSNETILAHPPPMLYLKGVIQPVKDRSHWTIRKFGSHEEMRCQQVKDWQALSGAARRQAAWELDRKSVV